MLERLAGFGAAALVATRAIELDLTEDAIVVILQTIMSPTVLLNFGERGAGP